MNERYESICQIARHRYYRADQDSETSTTNHSSNTAHGKLEYQSSTSSVPALCVAAVTLHIYYQLDCMLGLMVALDMDEYMSIYHTLSQ